MTVGANLCVYVCVLPAQAALCVDGAPLVLAASVQEGSVQECAGWLGSRKGEWRGRRPERHRQLYVFTYSTHTLSGAGAQRVKRQFTLFKQFKVKRAPWITAANDHRHTFTHPAHPCKGRWMQIPDMLTATQTNLCRWVENMQSHNEQMREKL